MIIMDKKKIALVAGIIIAVVAFRLFFNEMKWFNLFPIAAIGILVGSTFKDKRTPFLLLLGAMILTDVCFTLFVPFMAATIGLPMFFKYGAVLLVVLLGTKLNPSKYTKAIGFTIGGTLLFWVVSNFGVWAGGIYGYSVAGLIECYTMAIPFYQAEGSQLFLNAFTSNIAFSVVAFAIYNSSFVVKRVQLAKA